MQTMTLKLNVFKPRSYIRIVKVMIVICVAVTVAYSFFNALKKRSEDKQKELETYAEKIQLEKVKIQQARENPLVLSNNEGVSDQSESFWIHSLPQSVLIRNGPIRNTSEIFGFLKKWLVEFSKLSNPTGQFFQSKKQQSFCIHLSAVISKMFVKIDHMKKNI